MAGIQIQLVAHSFTFLQAEPGDEQALGDGIVVDALFEGLLRAAVDYWYVWIVFAALIVGAKVVTDWSKRVEARSRAAARPTDRTRSHRNQRSRHRTSAKDRSAASED